MVKANVKLNNFMWTFQNPIFTNLQVLSWKFQQLAVIQSKTLETQQSSSSDFMDWCNGNPRELITPGDNHQELAHLRWRDLKTLPWALETKSSAYHFPSVCLSVPDWQISHSINIAFFTGSSSGLRSVPVVILPKKSTCKNLTLNIKKKRKWIHLGLW